MSHNDLFEMVLQHTPDLVFVKDENSVILMANTAFLDVFPPHLRHKIIGTTMVEEFSAEEAATFLAEDRRALTQGRSEIVEDIIDYTGHKRVFLSRKIGFTTAKGERRLLGICSDITELAQRELSLIEANTRLQTFSAIAAHDLRSPLATFVSGLTLIRADGGSNLSNSARGYIDMMISSARSLASNISSMLTATKHGKSKVGLSLEDTDLNLLLAEVKFNLSEAIERTGAMIYVNRLPNTTVESNLFRQLFQNLIENSIKYRSSSRPPKIFIRAEQLDGRNVFVIEDNGSGVASAVAERAFDLYQQGTSVRIDGAGLGLPLCRQIVELHGGSIRIDPAFTDGCRIVFDVGSAAAGDEAKAA